MELFVVNRYTAEEPKKSVENEKDILQNLLKKVEKRKVNLTKDEHVKKKKHEEETKNDADSTLVENETHAIDLPRENDSKSETSEVNTNDFQVLGEDINSANVQHRKVDVVLPLWIAHPTVIPLDMSSSDEKELSIKKLPFLESHTCQALKGMNIKRLFPVQTAVIPWLLDAHKKPPPFRPRDVCVSAPTGSGKTLAFAVPIVQILANRVERKIRALVVLPVAELAQQVFHVFKKLCEKTDLSVCLLSKQFPFALEQKRLVENYKNKYHSKVDIVITTPGRLVEHLHSTQGFCLRSLKFLVIDEADSIMDSVFQNWLYHLDSHVRQTTDSLLSGNATSLCYLELRENWEKQPHKLLFSATLSKDPEKLKNLSLFHPKLFTSEKPAEKEIVESESPPVSKSVDTAVNEIEVKYTLPTELTVKYCLTENELKPLTLFSLVTENNWTKFLCFTNSAESSARLSFVLSRLFPQSLKISDLSALKSPKDRASVLSQFSRGMINGLICSDALARGIDIPDAIVISYDMPRHVKTFVHRIGRTGRAGRPGTAITILSQSEINEYNNMLAAVGVHKSLEVTVSTHTEETKAKAYSEALKALRAQTLREKNRVKVQKNFVKTKAIQKDVTEMTLMEKLQRQVTEASMGNVNLLVKQKAEEPKLNKKLHMKKFNPSAGKSQAITK